MRTSTLIQTVLVVFGIYAFFEGMQTLLSSFAYDLDAYFQRSALRTGASTLFQLLVIGSYLLMAYFFISRSEEWANWILQRGKLPGDQEITVPKVDILQLFFIALGAYMLIQELPYLINRLYTSFADDVSRNRDAYSTRTPWSLTILKILLPILTILFAKNLSGYFSKKPNNAEEQTSLEQSDSPDEAQQPD